MKAVLIKIRPAGSQKSRLIISVSAKVSKRAVVRNVIKRRIRVILQPLLKTLKRDFFIVVRPGAANLTFKDLKKQILDSSEIKLIRN